MEAYESMNEHERGKITRKVVNIINKRICPKCSTPWYSSDTRDVWKCEDCGSEMPVPNTQGNMNFETYCTKIALVPFYNYLEREQKDYLREQHEEYCKKNNLSPY